MAKKNESADDLMGDIKPSAKKAVKPDAKVSKPVAKAVKVVAKAITKAATKPEAAKPAGRKSAISDDMKLKVGKTAARDGSMFSIVAKAFGVGTTVKTAIERLKKTLTQPRGKSSKANPDTFIRGYVRGALAAGVIANA